MPPKAITRTLKSKESGVILWKFPAYFLLLCIGITGYFLLQILQPFMNILILSAVFSTAFYPLYDWVLKFMKGKERIAALTTCLLVFLFILVPLIIFAILLGRQAFDAYGFIQRTVSNGAFEPYLRWEHGGYLYDALGILREQIGSFVDIDSLDLRTRITEMAQTGATFLAAQSANIIKSIGWLAISLFILLFAMFYFFKDADLIIKKLMTLSPLPKKHEIELFKKFKEMSHAALYGILLTAIAQGFVGAIGFAIVGIPSSIFWGTAIALFSLVPIIGTATIWLPASIILLATGNIGGGLFLFGYGLLVVSTVDNFLRAYFIGEKTKMNQLLTFLAVFGGIGVFGLIGVIFGPLILALFFAFLHIYEKEYDKVLHSK